MASKGKPRRARVVVQENPHRAPDGEGSAGQTAEQRVEQGREMFRVWGPAWPRPSPVPRQVSLQGLGRTRRKTPSAPARHWGALACVTEGAGALAAASRRGVARPGLRREAALGSSACGGRGGGGGGSCAGRHFPRFPRGCGRRCRILGTARSGRPAAPPRRAWTGQQGTGTPSGGGGDTAALPAAHGFSWHRGPSS